MKVTLTNDTMKEAPELSMSFSSELDFIKEMRAAELATYSRQEMIELAELETKFAYLLR